MGVAAQRRAKVVWIICEMVAIGHTPAELAKACDVGLVAFGRIAGHDTKMPMMVVEKVYDGLMRFKGEAVVVANAGVAEA